jgi:hypothetical protein
VARSATILRAASTRSRSCGRLLEGGVLLLENVHPTGLLDESRVLALLDLDVAHGDLLVSLGGGVVLSGRVTGTYLVTGRTSVRSPVRDTDMSSSATV